MKPQVFSPALSLTLPLPPTLPSHLAPLGAEAETFPIRIVVPHSGQVPEVLPVRS